MAVDSTGAGAGAGLCLSPIPQQDVTAKQTPPPNLRSVAVLRGGSLAAGSNDSRPERLSGGTRCVLSRRSEESLMWS